MLEEKFGLQSNDRNTYRGWILTPAVHNVPGNGDGQL